MSGKCATTLPSFGEQEGRHLVLGVHPMLMVDTDAVVVERLLLAGGLTCPSCGGVLAPWGHNALAVFAPGVRRCAASASPGELHGLRQDACAVARGVAVASC